MRRTGRILAGAGVVLIAGTGLACGGSSNTGFHNTAVLDKALKKDLQQRLDSPSSPYYSPGVSVTTVQCVADSGSNTDTCIYQLSNGLSGSNTVVISANGQQFVTK